MILDAVIFDLDNTLAPTDKLEDIRERRAYHEMTPDVLARIKPYKKTVELLEFIKERGIKTAIVTNSGREYAEILLKHLDLPAFDALVTYTDVGSAGMKPSPKGISLALDLLGVKASEKVIYIGDDYKDIVASYYAGVKPIVPTWASRKPVSQVPAAVLSTDFIKDECNECDNIVLLAELSAKLNTFDFPRKRLYFVPLDESANVITLKDELATICLGRYFSKKSLVTVEMHDKHALSLEIARKDLVENYTPPDYWSDILAHAVDNIPQFFAAKKPFNIVTVIPSKKEKKQRLELVLDGAAGKSKVGSEFIPDLFVFEEGAKTLKTLPRDERAIEIEGSLFLNPKYEGRLRNKTILVFDDVITTGSTLQRAYSILKDENVKHTLGVCLAKTVSISETERLCPRCSSHILRLRKNSSTGIRFWGCSGYNDENEKCDYTEDVVIKSCGKCGRDMVRKLNRKKGTYFLSCTGWNMEPKCNNSESE